MKLWVVNMVICLILGFGTFIWALWETMKAENKKNKAK